MSRAMRFFFAVVSTTLWTGILLTGLEAVHWVLFIPALFLPFAALTGICPGLIISRWLFPEGASRQP
jgi:hypothetical protein